MYPNRQTIRFKFNLCIIQEDTQFLNSHNLTNRVSSCVEEARLIAEREELERLERERIEQEKQELLELKVCFHLTSKKYS